MKLKSFATAGVTTAIAITSVATAFSEPSHAQSTSFYCDHSYGKPTTMAETPRGTIPVIRWVSEHFTGAGYNPDIRCDEVSARFQTYYNNRTLSYLTTGIMNRQPVVCVTSTNGGPCTGLLFTLKPGQNASRTLQQLFDVRSGAAGPLYESTGGGSGKVYVDMNNFLNTAPVESTSPRISQPAEAPSAPEPVNPGGAGGPVW